MKNTMSKTEYILTQLWYSLLAMFWFRSTCFTFVFDLSKDWSRGIYWLILFITTIWGYKLTYKTKRNGFSVFVNAVLPNGIYLIISYFKYFTPVYWIVLGVGVLLSICFGTLIFSMKVKPGVDFLKLFKCRARHFLHGTRNILAICMVVLIVSIGTNSFLGNPMYKSKIESTNSVFTSKSWTVEQQIDTVKKLQPNIWNAEYETSDAFVHKMMTICRFLIDVGAYKYVGQILELSSIIGTFESEANEGEECVISYAIRKIEDENVIADILKNFDGGGGLTICFFEYPYPSMVAIDQKNTQH